MELNIGKFNLENVLPHESFVQDDVNKYYFIGNIKSAVCHGMQIILVQKQMHKACTFTNIEIAPYSAFLWPTGNFARLPSEPVRDCSVGIGDTLNI